MTIIVDQVVMLAIQPASPDALQNMVGMADGIEAVCDHDDSVVMSESERRHLDYFLIKNFSFF